MKRWVSNPLRALHWFGSSSNWLRSTPQSLLEACITHCHVADSTQGFSISSMQMYSEDKRRCIHQESGCRSEFLHDFTDTCPTFCCLQIARGTAAFPRTAAYCFWTKISHNSNIDVTKVLVHLVVILCMM